MAATASFLVVIRCVGGEEAELQGPAAGSKSRLEKTDVKGVRKQAEREPVGLREGGPSIDEKGGLEASKGPGAEVGEQDPTRSGGSLYRSTKTLRLPDYDWIHIQETYGTVQLYRHAPRYNSESESSPPRPPRTELVGGSSGATSVTEAVSGGLLIMEDDDRDQHYYTPFRSGRLSTLLVMGVPRDMPASAIMSSLSSVSAQLRSVHILRDHRSPVHHRSFLLLTLESHEAAERLHHAYNTPTPQHPLLPPPSPPADTATVPPSPSSSVHQVWDSTPELDASSAGLPGGRSLFVSGIVLVEPEGATVLSCLRSLMGTVDGLAHQGSVQVTGGRGGSEAHCLILASQENALSFLSSLVVEESRVASKGIDSYLAELPTCLQCLDKVDPSILQVPPPPFGYYPSMSSSSSSSRRSPSALDGNGATCCSVCRSVQKYADGPMACNTCQIPENLWICLLCAHVGCGRYTKEHAKQHFHQTGHILSLELATGRAWDYVEDVFVHVMTTRPLGGGGGGSEETGGGGGSMQHGGRGVDKDDPQQAKLAGLASEYNALLASQLDEQLRYYEQLLAKTAADWAQEACQDDQMTEEERREAEEARVLIRALEEEVDELMKQLREAEEQARNMRAKNEGLLEVQKRQKEQVADLKAKAAKAKEQCLAEQQDYEQQINDLTFFLRTQEAVKASPQRDELEGGHLVVTGGEDTSRARGRGRLGRKRGR